jgi:hypothetical protein
MQGTIIQQDKTIVDGLDRVYEITVPVGSPKRPGDTTNSNQACIQLVQFFLRDFFKTHPTLARRLPGPPGRFLIDGKAGPQTITGIGLFQQHCRTTQVESVKVLNDARVSVPLGKFVPGTGFHWTIHALNLFFAAQKKNEATFKALHLNPEINAEAKLLAADLVRAEQLVRS